jgi:Tol biopolymer transport system component
MSEDRNTLERELDRLSPPRLSLDQLAQRRDRRRRDQRIRAGVLGVAIAIAIVAGAVGIGAIRSTPRVPVEDPTPLPTTPTAVRGDGDFLVFTPSTSGAGWDLAAQDPETGTVRTIVETDGLVDCAAGAPCGNFIRKAEWSADGRWVAFEITNASLDGPPLGPCAPTVGVWVQGPDGVPRQVTTPCEAPPARPDDPVQELWEWSPVDARLAYARIDGEADELFVIDPSDGTRTSLTTGTIDPTFTTQASSLAWSPDGTRIAYVDGSSVYAVDVEGGERSLLAGACEDIIDIAWSPDGTRIMVHDRGRYRIQVMNADGSDLHVLLKGEDACCETAWSPNGDRIVYMLSVVGPGGPATGIFYSEVWTVSPDGSNPIKVFDGDRCEQTNVDALPVWAPNGTQIAYRGCGGWVVENADGTGEAQRIDELVWRSWYGGGLSQWDLAGIGQMDH